MARPRDNDEEDRVQRRRNRRQETAPGPAAGPSSSIAEPTTDYRGSGEFDRNSALERTMETGEMIPRNHFANEDEWAEYFAKVPQEFKRAHRERARANQERVYAGLADGMSLADLGITDEKEHGRALYRRLTAYGLLDPNYEYNWETGQKRNVGTSDLSARNRWEAIDPSEFQERQTQQDYGGDFGRRISDDATARISSAIAGGGLVRDPKTGYLINPGPNGPQAYYDDRGYFIDPATGQRTGGGHGMFAYQGGRQSGAGVFGGVGGSWGGNTPNAQPAAPPKPPPNPYYRPQGTPWGNPGAQPGMQQSGMTSPLSTNPQGFAPSPVSTRTKAAPWRLRRTFGAPS